MLFGLVIVSIGFYRSKGGWRRLELYRVRRIRFVVVGGVEDGGRGCESGSVGIFGGWKGNDFFLRVLVGA